MKQSRLGPRLGKQFSRLVALKRLLAGRIVPCARSFREGHPEFDGKTPEELKTILNQAKKRDVTYPLVTILHEFHALRETGTHDFTDKEFSAAMTILMAEGTFAFDVIEWVVDDDVPEEASDSFLNVTFTLPVRPVEVELD